MQTFGDAWIDIAVTIVVSVLLSALAWKMKLLTVDGSIGAMAVGLVVGLLGSPTWLFSLVVFTVLGFSVTLIGLSKKVDDGLQEGRHGERGIKNILGVGIPCCIFAVANFVTGDQYYYLMVAGYIGTIAVAAADTAASEIGIKDKKVRMITTFKKTVPGVDGGISFLGTCAAFAASTVVAVIAWALIYQTPINLNILNLITAGFIGCVLDSVLGATLETRGYIDKYGNNCITGIIGGVIAVVMMHFLF